MIPEFDSRGLLPRGVHRANWEEIVKRFGGNERRRKLLRGLKEALDRLKGAGCRHVYIDGSFVTAKRLPNDIDVCWDIDGVDAIALDSAFFDFDDGRAAQRAGSERNSFPRRLRSAYEHS